MSIRTNLMITTILILLLPLSVTIVTWWGLLRMGREIEVVAEEFAEARSLLPVESELNVAIASLRQDNDHLDDEVLKHLKRAEATLLDYLAEQYDSEASYEHQAGETQHAHDALTDLRNLIGPNWDSITSKKRLESMRTIHLGIRSLFDDANTGVIIAQQSATGIKQRTMSLVIVVSFLSALLCVFLSILSNRSISKSVRELHQNIMTRANGEKRLQPRDVSAAVSQIDELSERMYLNLKEKNLEILRRERVVSIGLLAADVAHEINNPMNAILGLSEVSLQTTGRGSVSDDSRIELHESLSVIRREAVRCKEIVERLMSIVRSRGESEWFDATRMLVETVEVAKASRPDKASCFQILRSVQPIQLFAPSSEVRQIILTFLINAADAVLDDGRIEVDATQVEDEVWVRVRDNGRGFTPEMHSDFPVAFRTTRSHEGGVGLGLSIAHSLAQDIGAKLTSFSDGLGKGSLFLLAIPAKEFDQ